jgi:hypothetical protein
MQSWLFRTVSVVSLVAPVTGCPAGDGDGDGDGDPEQFECELGIIDESGDFIPASEQTRAELDLGFQGLLFVEVAVRATGDVPGLVDALVSVTVEDEDPEGSVTNGVPMNDQGEAYVSDPVLLFFNSSIPAELQDRVAEIVIKLEDPARECTTDGLLLLVDDDPCIHTGDEPICPDDPDAGEVSPR